MTVADFFGAWDLFRDAVLTGVIAGAALGLLGVFIVLRRMVFVTAAITQSAGFGVVLGFWVGMLTGTEVDPVFWAVGVSLVAAAVFAIDPARVHLSRESILALVWLVGSGGAILLGDRIAAEAHDVSAILFGTAVLVRPEDLVAVGAVGAIAIVGVLLARRGLVFVGFDPDGARVQKVPVRLLELGFLALVTLVASVATRALGALPVFAFSVLPAMAALLATRRLTLALILALVGGGLAAFLGYLAAFLWDFPVGAAQAATALVFVLLALPIRLLRG